MAMSVAVRVLLCLAISMQAASASFDEAPLLARNVSAVSILTNIQDLIINFIRTVADFLSSAIPNLEGVVQNFISPVYSALNILASLSFLQLLEPLYAVVVILQAVFAVANGTLSNADNILNVTLSFTTAAEEVVNSVFAFIMGFIA